MTNLTCHGCGQTFSPKNKKPSQRFCTRSCGAKNRTSTQGANSGSFGAGASPWNKGKKNWRPGYQHSEATKQAIALASSGENAPNWKGGVSSENELFRKSAPYREWRSAVFDRDAHTCQQCGDYSRTGHRVRIHADHIKPFALYPNLRLDVDNGRTLCESCHRLTPTYGNGSRREFTGDTAVLEAHTQAAD